MSVGVRYLSWLRQDLQDKRLEAAVPTAWVRLGFRKDGTCVADLKKRGQVKSVRYRNGVCRHVPRPSSGTLSLRRRVMGKVKV